MPRNDYEERKAARIARYRQRAENAQAEAEQRCNAARQMLDAIPPGQPILVGHHSEKHHRAHLKRVDNNFRKANQASQKAEYYEERADAAASSRAVSSDDPAAIVKLKAKLERAEAVQNRMVLANKALKKNDTAALHALGFNDAQIEELRRPDFCGRPGFPSYALSNNSANIRRMRERIASLKATLDSATRSDYVGSVQIVHNAEANRVQVYFPEIPPATIRTALKSNGFRWSPTEKAWQRMISPVATLHAMRIAREYVEQL